MKKFSVILLTLVLVSAGARAVELMKWERIPLQIPLTVGQERIVFVNKNVRVGFPPALNDKLRIQSSGGVVYLDAKEAFPVTRLELQNKENGEILLLDVSAAPGKSTREPVKIVYDGEVATASATDKQTVSSDGDSAGRQSSAEAKAESRRPAKLNAPLPVVLTRYAAQNMYGPLRTVEPVPGVSPVSLKLPPRITTLMPSESVSVTPMAAWSLQGSSVIALQVRTRKSNASTYLPTIAALAAASAAGDAVAENQNTSQTNGYGGVTSTLTGDAGQAVLGKALSGGMRETVDWVKARYGQTFDAIYVPPGQKVALHITRQLAIDYEEKGRKVKYDDFSLAGSSTGMD